MIRMPKTAMVLAAGLGVRMRPLTDRVPKPLVEVNGVPLIENIIARLEKAGIERVIINTYYKAEMLEEYAKSRKSPEILISHEDEILETGGGIVNALPIIGDDLFYIVNCDIMWDEIKGNVFHELAENWDDNAMDSLLLVYPTEKARGYTGPGDFHLTPEGNLKRRQDGEAAPYVFIGMQLAHPRMFNGYTKRKFPLSELFINNEKDGFIPRIHGHVFSGRWMHVGDIPGLEEAKSFYGEKAG